MRRFLDYFLPDNKTKDFSVKSKENGEAVDEFPYEIQIAAENLYVPWALDIASDGRIYLTERSGAVRVIENGRLRPQPLITLDPPFISRGEGGLMGIVLDPDFDTNKFIYIMYSYAGGNQSFNRVIRLREVNQSAVIDRILIDRLPGGRFHNGGRIKIGPDRKLYITTGDAGNPESAQDLSSMAGKILRIELDGSIPKDNPFARSPVYSYGHRDPQGITWNSKGTLYGSEHGQSAHDELNIILPGANYGWPLVQGDEDIEGMNIQKPLIQSGEETWAPSGITFLKQGSWKGKLLVAALRGESLLAFTLNNKGNKVTMAEAWLKNQYGRLREVIQTADGSIYLTTSNRDGRGSINTGDDKVLHLIPKS